MIIPKLYIFDASLNQVVKEVTETYEEVSTVDKAISCLDAALFNGDAFLDDNRRRILKEYLTRWEERAREWDEISLGVKINDEQIEGDFLNADDFDTVRDELAIRRDEHFES